VRPRKPDRWPAPEGQGIGMTRSQCQPECTQRSVDIPACAQPKEPRFRSPRAGSGLWSGFGSMPHDASIGPTEQVSPTPPCPAFFQKGSAVASSEPAAPWHGWRKPSQSGNLCTNSGTPARSVADRLRRAFVSQSTLPMSDGQSCAFIGRIPPDFGITGKGNPHWAVDDTMTAHR